MLGFKLGLWDYITFAVLFVMGGACILAVIWIAGLPGRIAIARKHPDAEAIKLMGWAGLLPMVPWIQAFGWAFKPTETVDIRRFPHEERRAIAAEISQLSGKPDPDAGDEAPGPAAPSRKD